MMKRYGSVFGLWARSSLFKILGILTVMCLAEGFLFNRLLNRSLEAWRAGVGYGVIRPEALVEDARLPWIFCLSFLLITVCLVLPGGEYGSRVGYTLRRLPLGERRGFFCQAVYNVCVYALLWATQAVLCVCLLLYYTRTAPVEYVSEQTIFLAFWRDDFLHALLPLEEILLWIRNGVLVLALGFGAAEFPYRGRRGKFGFAIVGLAGYTMVFFCVDIGNLALSLLTLAVSVSVLGLAMWTVFGKEREVYEDEDQAEDGV